MRRAAAAIVVTLILFSEVSASQDPKRPPRDLETGKFTYQGVIEVSGTPADELYSRATAWVANAYRSAQDVIQLDDRNAGRLIVKGNLEISYYLSPAWIRHTLTIEVKDGRYRYTLTDFEFENEYWSAPLENESKFTGQRKSLFRKVMGFCDGALADLEEAMNKSSPVGDDEW